MNSEILGVLVTLVLMIVLSYPLGKYISKVFKGEKVWTDFLYPVEKFIYKISGINPNKEMDWKENMKALLKLNVFFFIWAFVIFLIQNKIPFWNPAGIGSMEPSLAFNTAVSFISNTNIQHYSGETGLSYFSQLLVVGYMQFVSAATGIAALALIFKGLSQRKAKGLGNFYSLWLRSNTRILLPLAIVVAVILLLNGTPDTFKGPQTIKTVQGDTVTVALGPAAPVVAIKQIGTNGGGFFGPNSAHPFENPNYITNIVECWGILAITMALVFAFGFYLNKKRLGIMIFAVMAIVYLSFTALAVKFEVDGNPLIKEMGIEQTTGSMEGKEVRFGPAASAFWASSTTVTSNGSSNSNHDSQTPLAGGIYIMNMMINSIFGGVGVGFINFFMFLIIAVFIAGLMVGRTPEFLGKKIEAKEVKIAALIILLHPFLILVSTAISAYIASHNPNIGWLTNPSYHGFSEMLYEFTSASANNGSEFTGLNANVPFWNIMDGVIMLIGRFLPIIGPVAIAGSLAEKKYIPESEGTLRLDSYAFGIVLLAVIIVISALSFFPALAVGPIAEHFSIL